MAENKKFVITVGRQYGSGGAEMAKRLVKWGIKGIWNFAPIDLHLPHDVTVENVHLAESLMTLTYNIHSREESEE